MNVQRRPWRILAISSGGGHWVQLMRLRPAFEGAQVTYATVDRAYEVDVGGAPLHVVTDATRWNPWRLAVLALQVARILVRVRPDVVVTTGAAPGYFATRLARLVGARTAWIDSMANAGRLSMCGARVGRSADMWLTQWPALAQPGGPSFEGSVL
ncbi:MAG: UDP-N-acetylglucosamine--LPS N-acetylglucosamine transferase [Planctomycetes bacterium]|nr:UDP-N-acetylglucosamine--LPS N-acetylglucosamine transferase [Planctomycetota bacterium]